MGRAPQNALGSPSSCTCCSSAQLRRGPWTSDEDELLARYMNLHGDRGNWRKVPKAAGLLRCGKSCRLRWLNYLRPDLKRGSFSEDEEDLIVKLHALLGNRWSLIAGRIPGRSDNEIKNYWNFHLAKKLLKMGINPKTHKRLENTGETRPEAKLLTLTKSPREPDVSLDLSSKQVDICSSLTSSEEQSVNASKFCHSSSFSSVTSSITLESPSAKPVEAPSRLEQLIISSWNENQQSGAEEGYEIIRNSSNEEAEDALFNEQFSSFGSAVEELELQNHMMMFGLSQSLWHSPLASPSVVDKVHPDFWN